MCQRIWVVMLAACGSAVPPVATAPPPATIGTAGPYELRAAPTDGRWLVVCQARTDTDHDGKLAVFWEIHGEAGGDALVAYLVDDRGRETVLDNVLAVDPKGRYLAVVEHGAQVLIDAQTWHRTPLDGEPPGFSIVAGVRRWEFDPNGTHLLRFRGGRPVVRELATGTERIAPAAWRAEWSGDGSWLELDTLAGDTNHDGFTHGPDLSPTEGVPGQECGRKFKWHMALDELDPDLTHTDAAMASLENPDELVHSVWRLGDALAVAAQSAIDRDTIAARSGGALRIGKVGAPLAVAGDARCKIEAVFGPSLILTCPIEGGHTRVEWLRGTERKVIAADLPDDRVLVEGDRTGYAGIFPFQMIVDMRDGSTVLSSSDVYYAWSDADHVLIQHKDDTAMLVWRDGRRVVLQRTDEHYAHVAGRYLVRGHQRVDLVTAAVVALPSAAIAVRSDGRVLVDGGEQHLAEGDRGPRVGPLRWVAP